MDLSTYTSTLWGFPSVQSSGVSLEAINYWNGCKFILFGSLNQVIFWAKLWSTCSFPLIYFTDHLATFEERFSANKTSSAAKKATCCLILNDSCHFSAQQKAFVLLPLDHFTQITYIKGRETERRKSEPSSRRLALLANPTVPSQGSGLIVSPMVCRPTNRPPWVKAQSQRQDTGDCCEVRRVV